MDIENKTLEILDLVREKVLSPDEALPHILRLFGVSGSCDHSLIDARNDIIQSGYMCIKCNALFRANDH